MITKAERNEWKHRIWTTARGEKIKVKHMDTTHIMNTLKMLIRSNCEDHIMFPVLKRELAYRGQQSRIQKEKNKKSNNFEIFF